MNRSGRQRWRGRRGGRGRGRGCDWDHMQGFQKRKLVEQHLLVHMKTSQCIYATIINLQINRYFPHTIKFILIETRSSLYYFTYYCFLKSLLPYRLYLQQVRNRNMKASFRTPL